MKSYFVPIVLVLLSSGCSDHAAEPATQSPAAGSVSAVRPANWSLEEKTDALTDKRLVIATSVGASDGSTTTGRPTFVARCSDGKLEAYVVFTEFLNSSDSVPVRYRFDLEPLAEGKWLVSTEGTSAFAEYNKAAALLRKAINAKRFIIEGVDFKGTAHRATFPVEGGESAIAKVLSACRLPLRGLADSVPGLREEVAAEIELLGPRQVATYKEILASLRQYDGPIDSVVTPEFALAAQGLIDQYAKMCRAKYKAFSGALQSTSPESIHCLLYFSAGVLDVSTVMYARAKGELSARAGKLRRGD